MFKTLVKGELTVVISENNTKVVFLMKKLLKKQIYLKKYSLKDVVDLLFKTEKVNKKGFTSMFKYKKK